MAATASLENAAFQDQRATGAIRGRAPIDWFPDWSGQACAIIAPGPSAKKANIAAIRGKLRVIAIKECAVDLCPWADVVYGCDAAWWRHRKGMPDFKGLKVAWARTEYPEIKLIQIKKDMPGKPGREWVNTILTEPGVIGSGDNSAFQALNLAIQFGSRRLMFVGLDLRGEHYYGRNTWYRAGNPDESTFERCRKNFTDSVPVLNSLGVDVVNVSPWSSLMCFRRSTIEQTLVDWGL